MLLPILIDKHTHRGLSYYYNITIKTNRRKSTRVPT